MTRRERIHFIQMILAAFYLLRYSRFGLEIWRKFCFVKNISYKSNATERSKAFRSWTNLSEKYSLLLSLRAKVL